MPAATRPRRPLLIVALVAGLLAATAPIGAGAVLHSGHAADLPAGARADVLAADLTAAAGVLGATAPSTVVGTMTLAQREARALWLLKAHPPTIASKAVAGKTGSAGSTSTQSSSTRYVGRNHVWIPTLGVSRSITFYACSSSYYPANRVYRWGCAGSNNIYLFGHAFSVFKPLHDAYIRGRLQKGMRLYYANGSGKVSTYAVSWWKLTTPSNGEFAYAAQSTPSLTLQTCVGAQSQYRLIVRLRKVG
jgi:sortase (surface protein transpeptidase)